MGRHWTCPYCGRDVTITNENYQVEWTDLNKENKDGVLKLETRFITCPNIQCQEYTLTSYLYKTEHTVGFVGHAKVGDPILWWQMRPRSFAKPIPDYVPKPIRDDYEEACLIRDLSAKASATLSRRCLQGMIRDFWNIQKKTLYQEIAELETLTDKATWDAIDAVRKVGNIGAHMEKDINVVIDVEPEEAQLLINLIEILFKDWYITRYEREMRLQQITALAQSKKTAANS